MTLEEHARAIQAAIQAAKDEGFKFEIDVTWDAFESALIETMELDIWQGTDWINVYTERRQ